MRIAHISLFGPDPGQCLGIVNKLERLAKAANTAAIPIDFYSIHMPDNRPPDEQDYRHVRFLHVNHRNLLAARWQQCNHIRDLLQHYQRVILRYPGFDPVCVLRIPDPHRIVLEHHIKEVPHLRDMHDIRWPFERVFGGMWLRRFAGLTAVTPEILDYEVRRSRFQKRTGFFPNSIPMPTIPLPDGPVWNEQQTVLRMAWVIAKGFDWNGLESIVMAFKDQNHDTPIELHVTGHHCERAIRLFQSTPNVFYHPYIKLDDLGDFYRDMHVGLGSFNLSHGAHLKQATPLKIREYLAFGLPVVYNYEDPAFPDDFPFHLKINTFDIACILEYIRNVRHLSRIDVRAAAHAYIDSESVLKRLYDFCTA